MKPFVRLIAMLAPVWPVMLLAVCLGWLTIAANIGLMVTSAWLIAAAALHPSIAELSVAIVGVRFFGVARAVFRYLERYISHDATFRILSRLRVGFYQRLEPLAPANLQTWQSGELFSAIVGDVETLKDFYLRVLAPPLIAVLTLTGLLLVFQHYSLSLAAWVFAGFLLAVIVLPLAVRQVNKGGGSELVAARAALKAYLLDTVNGMTEIAAFDHQQRHLSTIRNLNDHLIRLQGRIAAVSSLSDSWGSLIMNGTLWGVLWLLIPLVRSGTVEGVYLAAMALAVQSSFEAVLPLPMAVHYCQESLAAARRLFRLVDAPAAVLPSGQEQFAEPEQAEVCVQGVSFEYDGLGKALNRISFSLRPGKRVALIGPSGAGKSTIIHLLLRFWEIESGLITLNGRDYRTINPEAVRRLFSVVSQQTHIFNASIRENILLACPEAGERELMAAVRGAALDEFTAGLPEGLDTQVGNNGQALSGGQRQRIAIARALLKNTPVLLLDEPTVGLDPITAKQIMNTIDTLMRGRATLLITHDLTDVETMDEILVLDQGEVTERGTFAELLNSQGLFARLWHLQQTPLA